MNRPSITRIDQSKLRESVYNSLRNSFTLGEFAPGDVVSLRYLADQLGTSITPVREAVRRLVAEGALEDTPSRKLMVPQFSYSRMHDLKKARLALEALVLDQAMDKIKPEDIADLKVVLRERHDSDLVGPDLQQNYDFHFKLYRHSNSEVLLPIVESLWLRYGAYLNLIIRHQDAALLPEHKHHHEILDAISSGDREAAQAALATDIERSFLVLAHEDTTKGMQG